jgi:spermidine synthase
MVIYLSVFLLSASALAYEIVLSRLFSIAQFYHFAFMTVSLALLGAGASGTALAVSPRLRQGDPARRLSAFGLAAALATVASWALANWLPFDSFAIAWDRRQALYLVLMYLALAAPFFFDALAVGWLLAARANDAPRIYAANLAGSAVGCFLALGALATWGGEGSAVFCAWLAALASLAPVAARKLTRHGVVPGVACLVVFVILNLWLWARPALFTIRLSPYKALSQSLRYPGAQQVWTRWNASVRVDLVRSPGIRSFPGLSYAYLGPLPRQDGLTFDGDDLSPITLAGPEGAGFADYMPGAVAFHLRPGARVLILQARGGLDVIAARACGASHVTAVEPNEIAVEAMSLAEAIPLADPRAQFVVEDARSFVRRSRETFDVVQLALSSPYRPVTSGAYSLIEDYDLTVQAFGDDLARLNEGGLLVVTRWLQSPPSEPLRLFALAVTAAERARLDPARSVVALRGYNTATVIVKRGAFASEELDAVREFAAARKFDLVALPGLRPEEANLYNVLPDDEFYRTFNDLLTSADRGRFYAAYPFDVSPPTDDRPFFGHYFKWEQAGEVWAQLGKTWQPFGGAGYFVLVVLLAFAVAAAGTLIVLPLAVRGVLSKEHQVNGAEQPLSHASHLTLKVLVYSVLVYFAMLGFGFMFIEIPLVQRLILLVGKPVYALAVALFALLLFSGLGSLLSRRAPWRGALAALAIAALVYPLALPALFKSALGLSLIMRFVIGVMLLAPLGVLMGVPFPKGMAWLEQASPDLIPWAWGVNGAVSVVASVLASLLALSAGFSAVLIGGALCYGMALIVISGPIIRRYLKQEL